MGSPYLTETEDKFRFRAFISYSSYDRNEGDAFQSFLEKYKLPRPLRVKAGGKRLGRIFRDRSDLVASSSLAESIESALRQSQFLIVLCSPQSAASKWVNQEIRFFKSLGRHASIIPVLVEGTPATFDLKECEDGAFPPALFEAEKVDEPFAPDLRDTTEGGDGFELAALKVISKIIDVPLDELTERHFQMLRAERRRDRRRIWIVSGLAASASIAAFLAWQQTQTSNKLLAQALEAISDGVSIASGLKDRYGVPSEVSQEFYEGAREKLADLEDLEGIVGQHPKLRLERTRFELSMADFSNSLGLEDDRAGHITSAANSFTQLTALENSGWKYFFPFRPDEDTLLQTEQRLHSAEALSFSDKGEFDRAIASVEGAIAKAKQQIELPDQESWSVHLAQNYCELGSIQYAASNYPAAKDAYNNCHATAVEHTTAATSTIGAEIAVDAMSQIGMIGRAQNDPIGALEGHKAAVEQAKALLDQFPDNSRLKRRVAQEYGKLGDSLRGAGQRPDEVVAAYSAGLENASSLLASDPARRDWQRDKMLLLERLSDGLLESLYFSDQSEPELVFERIDRTLNELETMSDRILTVDPDDIEQQRIHSTLLERRAVAAMVRSELTGVAGNANPVQDVLKSIELRQNVADSEIVTMHNQYILVQSHITAGRVIEHFGESTLPAITQYEAALSLLKTLVEDEEEAETQKRDIDNWRYEIALIHYLKARAHGANGRVQSGLRDIAESRAIVEVLLEKFPDVPRYQAALDDLNMLEASLE